MSKANGGEGSIAAPQQQHQQNQYLAACLMKACAPKVERFLHTPRQKMQPWFSGPFDDPRYINHSGRTRHQWSLVHAGTLWLEVGTGSRIGGIRLAGSNLDSQSDGRSHQ
jgi:hypothetical protein